MAIRRAESTNLLRTPVQNDSQGQTGDSKAESKKFLTLQKSRSTSNTTADAALPNIKSTSEKQSNKEALVKLNKIRLKRLSEVLE